jgi:hypothetical protein
MDNIISFKESRLIINSKSLCYNNTVLHFLYSLIDFRNAIYNLTVLSKKSKDHKDLLFNFKKLFSLMDKRINNINSDISNSGDFFNNIYEPIFLTILDEFTNLHGKLKYKQDKEWFDKCEAGELDNSMIRTLNICSDISNKLFCNIEEDFNEPEPGKKKYIKYTFTTDELKNINLMNSTFELNSQPLNINKYIIIEPSRNVSPVEGTSCSTINRFIPEQSLRLFGKQFCLIAILTGNKANKIHKENKKCEPEGHYWLNIVNDKDTTKFNEVNDLKSYKEEINLTGDTFYAVYVDETKINSSFHSSASVNITKLSIFSMYKNKNLSNKLIDINYEIYKKLITHRINNST